VFYTQLTNANHSNIMTKNNICHYFSSMPGHYSVMTTGVNWV